MIRLTKLSVLVVLMLFSCRMPAQTVAEGQADPAKTKKTESATIYFFRPTELPIAFQGALLLDGVDLGKVSAGCYAIISVKPGSHDLAFTFPDWSGIGVQSLSLFVESDKSYYLAYGPSDSEAKVEDRTGSSGLAIGIGSVSDVDGQRLSSELELAFAQDATQLKNDAQAGSPSAAAENETPILMEPVVINGNTFISFHFSVRVLRDKATNHVVAMYVDQVKEGSSAEESGLRPGAEIVAIEGKPVGFYEATFRYGSDLNKIFIGRREGDQVTLSVVEPGENRVRKVVVTRRRVMTQRFFY